MDFLFLREDCNNILAKYVLRTQNNRQCNMLSLRCRLLATQSKMGKWHPLS